MRAACPILLCLLMISAGCCGNGRRLWGSFAGDGCDVTCDCVPAALPGDWSPAPPRQIAPPVPPSGPAAEDLPPPPAFEYSPRVPPMPPTAPAPVPPAFDIPE